METCPACGFPGQSDGAVRGEPILACSSPECGLRFLSAAVRPSADLDNHWYAEWLGATDATVQSARSAMRPRYRKQLALMVAAQAGARVIDVGSGLGLFVDAAAQAGHFAVGVELSEHGRAFSGGRLGLNVTGSLSELDDEAFDAVRASHVLEHLADPLPVVQEMAAKLRPGAAALVIVPHREPISEAALNLVRRCVGRGDTAGAVYPHMHVLGFDHRSLPALMRRGGFELVWMRGVGMGDRTFYPWFYDDLVQSIPFRRWWRMGWKYCVPRFVNRLGAPFGRGDWIAALFRKVG